MGIQCAFCGYMNDNDAVFCEGCGNPVSGGMAIGPGGGVASGGFCACGAPLEPDSAFCTVCGRPVSTTGGGGMISDSAPLTKACPVCGTPNEADAKFCVVCGSDISGDSSHVIQASSVGSVIKLETGRHSHRELVINVSDDPVKEAEMHENFGKAGDLPSE